MMAVLMGPVAQLIGHVHFASQVLHSCCAAGGLHSVAGLCEARMHGLASTRLSLLLPPSTHTVTVILPGYDAHCEDPLEKLQLQAGSYHWLTSAVRRVADELCGGRLLLLLEGG